MSDRRELQRTRMRLRLQISRAYVLVHSRSVIDRTQALSIDDYRNLSLEQIEGPEDPEAPLISHTLRRLSDVERVEEIRLGIQSAVDTLLARPDLFVEPSGE